LEDLSRFGEVFDVNFDLFDRLDGVVLTFSRAEDAQQLLSGNFT